MLSLSPSREAERLAAVHRYDVLDTPADGTFDRITALAASVFDVPIAIVTVVDEDRIRFHSAHGVAVTDVPREPGLCASAILRDEPYVLDDATVDPVARHNSLVAGEPRLRFYAAAPLTTSDGLNLGTLCIADHEPRSITPAQVEVLSQLAALVVDGLELRLSARAFVAWESDLRRSAEHGQRSAEELAVALQRALLPPALPVIPGVDVAARYRPMGSADIGGDFYDVFPLRRNVWGVAVGDVCGKGPEAAAITTAARYALRAAAIDHAEPRRVLDLVNEALLLDDGDDGMRFCTVAFGRLRASQGSFRLTVSCGGHPLPLLRRRDGTVEAVAVPGTAVGLVEEARFADRRARLEPGDAVLFFTDGLTELRVGGELFGTDRVVRALADAPPGDAAGLLDAVEAAVAASGGRQADDIAMLALVVRDAP